MNVVTAPSKIKFCNMYFKHLLLTVLVISQLIPSALVAQDFDNYTPSTSQGELPKDLFISSTQKYLEAKENNTQIAPKRKDRKSQDQFFLENNFVLDELLRSGQLIFNDPMSNYVNKVLDNLLKNDPKLRSEIKVYMVRSSSVNAFATDRGEIFVNIGLLAQLNNEAELAFILCHELQHYIEQHNMNSYVEFKRIERNRGYRCDKSYEKIVAKHSYSRDLETEADTKGFELFQKSDYSLNAAKAVFDVLALAHVPYSNKKIDFSFLESDYVLFDANRLMLDSINEIRPYEEDESEWSTHPSTSLRKAEFLAKVEAANDSTGAAFLQSEDEFKRIQKIARFDLCDILVGARSYPAAFYHSYLLLEEYPNNSYAEKNIAKSLYGIAQYVNKENYYKITMASNSIQGEIQAAFYFFEKMTNAEVNTLAGRYLWEMHQKYPKDRQIELMAMDMIEDIIIFHLDDEEEDDPNVYFKKTKFSVIVATKNNKDDANAEEDDKDKGNFARYAFADFLEDETFQEWLNNEIKYREKRRKQEQENGDNARKRRKKQAKKRKENERKA